MLRLSIEDIEKLQAILIEHCEAKSSSYLKALITNSQIKSKNRNIDYNLPANQWVEIIQANLSKTYSFDTTNSRKRLDFVLFLEYFEIKLYPESDERLFIKDIIHKIDNSPLCESELRINNTKHLLNQRRQEKSRTESSNSSNIPQKIDKSIIVYHDLEDLAHKVNCELGFSGIFPFCISGQYTILEEYIIERILKEHKNKTVPPRSYKAPINIPLHNHLINQESKIIEYELIRRDHCAQLIDLVQKTKKLDTVIIIWNHDIEKKKIETISCEFLTAIQKECLEFLEKNNQCLIIILANIFCEIDINRFISLRTPGEFILEGKNGLIEWFKYHINQIPNLPSGQIDRFFEDINGHNGDLIKTYKEIKDIIDELNGRYLING